MQVMNYKKVKEYSKGMTFLLRVSKVLMPIMKTLKWVLFGLSLALAALIGFSIYQGYTTPDIGTIKDSFFLYKFLL